MAAMSAAENALRVFTPLITRLQDIFTAIYNGIHVTDTMAVRVQQLETIKTKDDIKDKMRAMISLSVVQLFTFAMSLVENALHSAHNAPIDAYVPIRK